VRSRSNCDAKNLQKVSTPEYETEMTKPATRAGFRRKYRRTGRSNPVINQFFANLEKNCTHRITHWFMNLDNCKSVQR
jgi:hypothetical protein